MATVTDTDTRHPASQPRLPITSWGPSFPKCETQAVLAAAARGVVAWIK